MRTPARIALFTIVARNYIAYARSLLASVAEFEPNIDRFVFIVDDLAAAESIDEGRIITPMDVFGYEAYVNMAYGYDVTELSTSVKPFIMRYLLGQHYDRVFYFDPDIQLFAALDPVIEPLETNDIVLTPHMVEPMPLDGKRPDEIVLLRAGAYNLGFIGVSNTSAARGMLDWWSERLKHYCLNDVQSGLFVDQKWIDLVPGLVEHTAIVRHRGCNVAYWNLHERRLDSTEELRLTSGEPVIFFHFSGFDVKKLDQLSKHQTRIALEDEPRLKQLLRSYADRVLQLGHLERLKISYGLGQFSNGVPLDAFGRTLLREALNEGIRFPDPNDVDAQPSAWMYVNEPLASERGRERPITRYMYAVWDLRSDLRLHFPDMLGNDRHRYIGWLESDPSIAPAYLETPWPDKKPKLASRKRASGVNIAGYFRTESGVGESGRAHLAAIHAAGLGAELLDFSEHAPSRSGDSTVGAFGAFGSYPVNLVCVNADQIPHFVSVSGSELFRNHYNIGSWWWELPQFPDRYVGAFEYFDEIWAGTQFIATALARKSPVPVVLVPPVVNVGTAHPVARETFGLSDDETTFLFMFDFLSIFERKNPLGVITAFKAAFGSSERVRLVLKSINTEHDPAGSSRITEAIANDERITTIDTYLSRDEKNCLIATCDAYVSLHRSEGFGYTPAEAMALGKPVIATAWSGNADYMTPSNCFPVGYRLVELGTDHGPYEASQIWAEPDLAEAAAAMRAVYERPYEAARRGERGREEIASRFSASAVGRIVGERLDLIENRLREQNP